MLGPFPSFVNLQNRFRTHLAEREAQPDKFGTIPDAMGWSIATLATIGYGDVVPITPLGKLIAAATILPASS